MTIDKDSATWRAVEAWAAGRITASHAMLENTGMSLEQTEFQRGRIAALRELLKLPTPSKINPAHSTYVE